MIKPIIVYPLEDLDFIYQILIGLTLFLDFSLLKWNTCLILESIFWDGVFYFNGEISNISI